MRQNPIVAPVVLIPWTLLEFCTLLKLAYPIRPNLAFAHDPFVFLDINECLSTSVECEAGCRNTEGSYECVCGDGERIGNDGKSCKGKKMLTRTST